MNHILWHHLDKLIQKVRSSTAFESALAQIHLVDQLVPTQLGIIATLVEAVHPHEPVCPILYRDSFESGVDAWVQGCHGPF